MSDLDLGVSRSCWKLEGGGDSDSVGGLIGSQQVSVLKLGKGLELGEQDKKEGKMEKKARFHVVSQQVSGTGIPHYAKWDRQDGGGR